MRITQAFVSPGLRFFRAAFCEKYKLRPYHDIDAPAVFFGCYGEHDRRMIAAHRGLLVMVWAGSDAMRLDAHLPLFTRPNIRHIAIGAFIAADLAQHGIAFREVPVTPFVGKKKPVEKGPSIYAYVPEGREDFYGKYIIDALNLPYEIIIGGSGRFERERMEEIYRRCFIGLRLTPHDGLPNTVVELGLMGIPCVYNGGLPGSLPFNNIPDIRSHISQEARNIGLRDNELAGKMEAFVKYREDWLQTEYYQ
jgi:hypothetical protein